MTNWASYDYADFGCSNGNSIEQAKRLFGGVRGVGIDINPKKVAAARESGHDVVQGDLTNLDVPDDAFRFVTMSHFLEHLPTVKLAEKCIATGVRTSTDFVFIRQPWFCSDSYLMNLGLKQYWSDWVGHPNRMDLLGFYFCLRDLPKSWEWKLYGRTPVLDSSDTCILPLSSPIDQHHYEPERHGHKPVLNFDQPVYREIVCVIYRPDVDHEKIVRKISPLDLLYTS